MPKSGHRFSDHIMLCQQIRSACPTFDEVGLIQGVATMVSRHFNASVLAARAATMALGLTTGGRKTPTKTTKV